MKSLNEAWEVYRNPFIEWLTFEVSNDTKKDYLNALSSFFAKYTIVTLGDLEKALMKENYKSGLAKALRKLITFFELREIINEQTTIQLRRIIKLKRAGIREVFITDKEIREAYYIIKQRGEAQEMLFRVLVYSGIRLSQAVQMLNAFDIQKLYIINDKIARYPLFSTSKGVKRGFWAYLPREFAEELKRFNIKYTTSQDWVRYKKVSANTIRKWHYTFLVRHGIAPEVADYIQGRSPQTIGARHYGNKEILADESYSNIVDKIKEVLEEEG